MHGSQRGYFRYITDTPSTILQEIIRIDCSSSSGTTSSAMSLIPTDFLGEAGFESLGDARGDELLLLSPAPSRHLIFKVGTRKVRRLTR